MVWVRSSSTTQLNSDLIEKTFYRQPLISDREPVVTTFSTTFVGLTCYVSRQRLFLPPGYWATSLEGEMPASFCSSGSTFKYSQTLQARRLNLSVDGRCVCVGGGVLEEGCVCVGVVHNAGVRTVGRHWNMTIIGSPDSSLTCTSSRTGPSHSDALIPS